MPDIQLSIVFNTLLSGYLLFSTPYCLVIYCFQHLTLRHVIPQPDTPITTSMKSRLMNFVYFLYSHFLYPEISCLSRTCIAKRLLPRHFTYIIVCSLLQATLLDSTQGTYEKFLKTLMDAKRHRWKPSKVGGTQVVFCTTNLYVIT